MNIYFAPLQGYTEDTFRRTHHMVCGGVEEYFTPFLRLEHGEVRSKDRRDIKAERNAGVPVTPQIICGSGREAAQLIDTVLEEGYDRIDLNMGCPFPLQTRHGHGAGILPHPDAVRDVCDTLQRYPDVAFSVKMRLGLSDKDEWKAILPILNDAPLRHITLHPRIGEQQYRGEADLEAFEAFAQQCRKPLIYNGDLQSAADISKLAARFPMLSGVMIGRGLLARPTLAREYAEGRELPEAEVIAALLKMHDMMHEHYRTFIPTEAAVLQKLRTFWDYTEPTIGHKAAKKLKKAGNLRNYLAAVNELR